MRNKILWIFFLGAAHSASHLKAQGNATQPTLATLRDLAGSMPSLRLEGTAIFGSGNDEKHGNVTIVIDPTLGYHFTFLADNVIIEEHYSTSLNAESCQTADDTRHHLRSPGYACSAPGPWFFPFYGLAQLSSESWALVKTSQSPRYSLIATEKLYGKSDSSRSPLADAELALTDTPYLLSEYRYNFHSRSLGSRSLIMQAVYSQYSLQSGIQIPLHIKQSLGGIAQFDISIATVSAQ